MNTQKQLRITFYVLTWLIALLIWVLSNVSAQTVGDVISIAWSPDGARIVGGGTNGLLRIWNMSGNTIINMTGLSGNVYSVDWSPDNTKIVSGHDDGIVRVWNASTGQLITTLTGHKQPNLSVDWSPDGSRIVTSSFYDTNDLRVWNANTYQLISVADTGTIFDVAWSPDSAEVVTALENGFLGIHNATLDDPTSPQAINSANLTARWSPNGTQIASGDYDGQIHIWNASTYASIANLTGHTDRVDAIAFRPNGENLASASNDGTIRIWYLPTGQTVKTFSKPVIFTTSIAWSPEGRRLAYGGTNGTVNIITVFEGGTGLRGQYFDVNTLTTLKFYRLNPIIDFNWGAGSPDTVIAADTFSIRWTGKVEPLYSQTYTFSVTHNDGARLWVNGQQIINNWTNTTNAVTDSGTIALTAWVKVDIVLEYYENTGNASVKLEWSSSRQPQQVIPASQLYPPEGQLAFTGRTSGNDEIYVINPDGSGETLVGSHAASDTNAVWSPDGTKVAFVTLRHGNEDIYVVNADGSGLLRLTTHTAVDHQPVWSPDSTKIVFTSLRTGGGDIYVVAATGGTQTQLTTSTGGDYDPMWSPNGQKIVYVNNTANNPETWIMNANGSSQTRMTNRSGYDVSPFFSPDGTKVAIRAPYGAGGSGDQIWVISTTAPFNPTRLTTQGSNYFQSWSPDGSKILFQSTRDGNAEVYSMDTNGLNETQLTDSAAAESYAVWSADARQIAFVRSNDIYLMNADGSNQRPFTSGSRVESQIVWWQPKQSY
jgi:Tol biopolymer transport system component